MKSINYIFCPLCGSSKWTTDKADPDRLERYKCSECKEFAFSNYVETVISPAGLKVFTKRCHSITATVDPYLICISYVNKKTEIFDPNHLILTLEKPLEFNWYRKKEVIEKIKKYLVFS